MDLVKNKFSSKKLVETSNVELYLVVTSISIGKIYTKLPSP